MGVMFVADGMSQANGRNMTKLRSTSTPYYYIRVEPNLRKTACRFVMTDVLMYVCTDGWMDGCVDGCRRIPNTRSKQMTATTQGSVMASGWGQVWFIAWRVQA